MARASRSGSAGGIPSVPGGGGWAVANLQQHARRNLWAEKILTYLGQRTVDRITAEPEPASQLSVEFVTTIGRLS